MEFRLDDTNLKSIVSAAVLQTLTAESRDELIKQAVSHLMQPDKMGRYGNLTPLEQAFGFAVEKTAREIIADIVRDDDAVKTALRDLAAKSIAKAMLSETVVNDIADAIGTMVGKAARGY